ncbi:hypothetical protein K438DRAFT_1761750 [Mycena galopus ATCC 62051]|nr:hypothetical protein K438DRAFT_1761750 [Mycena galopus ATCC 62051]
MAIIHVFTLLDCSPLHTGLAGAGLRKGRNLPSGSHGSFRQRTSKQNVRKSFNTCSTFFLRMVLNELSRWWDKEEDEQSWRTYLLPTKICQGCNTTRCVARGCSEARRSDETWLTIAATVPDGEAGDEIEEEDAGEYTDRGKKEGQWIWWQVAWWWYEEEHVTLQNSENENVSATRPAPKAAENHLLNKEMLSHEPRAKSQRLCGTLLQTHRQMSSYVSEWD